MNRILLTPLIAGLTLCTSTFVQAQSGSFNSNSDPWFEIEFIAFERGTLSQTLEKFADDVTPIPVQRSLDLLKPLYQPDIRALQHALPWCQQTPEPLLPAEWRIADSEPQPWFDDIQLAEQMIRQLRGVFPEDALLQWPLTCRRPQPQLITLQGPQLVPSDDDAKVAGPQLLPVIPVPASIPVTHQQSPYLVDESAFQLKDLAWQLSHKAGHKLLLHTVWRQALGPKRRTESLRFFAGQRFSPAFNYQGELQTPALGVPVETAGLTTAIEHTYQLLQQGQPLSRENSKVIPGVPDEVWQLDGVIQPYNERMLFADTEFNLRQLVSQNGTDHLQNYYVKDSVRLLLGEIHYLDHPRFGLIIQIRRFTPPVMPMIGEGVTP